MRRLLLLLTLGMMVGSPAIASDVRYSGPPLEPSYDGPVLVHNSQLRYTAADRLTFSTADLVTTTHPELLPLRSAIDTWASRLSVHPRVLAAVVDDYFSSTLVKGDRLDLEAVVQIASALATVFESQIPDSLAASRAVAATANALRFDASLPPELVASRGVGSAPETAPPLFGYFQPPWEVGDTWAGGGAHGSSHNALDFWGRWVPWGGDTTPYWVAAMQEGVARVWSSCSVSVIHPNNWVTHYYHLDNVQVADHAPVQRNDRLANYADNEAQAICDGGWSSGPHVHMSLKYDGDPVSVDQSNLDFTAFSHHENPDEDYDFDCETTWYNHYTEGIVCPSHDQLLNNTPDLDVIFIDGFESGSTSAWANP